MLRRYAVEGRTASQAKNITAGQIQERPTAMPCPQEVSILAAGRFLSYDAHGRFTTRCQNSDLTFPSSPKLTVTLW